MNPSHGLTKMLAFTVLACCAGMGLCVSLLGFTWATGDLPFGLRPMIRDSVGESEPEQEKPADTEWDQADKQRYGELYAARLYAALRKEREDLAAQRRKLEERETELKEFEKTANMLADKLQKAEERASKLLEYTDETERANVRRLSSILAGTDAVAGPKLLLSVPPATAARLIEAMDSRKAAEMLGALANSKDAAAGGQSEGAKEILAHFQKLSPLPPPAFPTTEKTP